MSGRELSEISTEFNSTIRKLLTTLEKKCRSEIESANLNTLKRRIGLLKSGLGEDALLKLSTPFFIEFSDKILEPDVTIREEFFLTLDLRKEYAKRIKGDQTKEDEFMFEIVDSIRAHYRKSSRVEKDSIYLDVNVLLQCALEYQLQ